MSVSIIITGASGLLGRAVCREFKKNAPSWLVQGLAWSRAAGDLLKVDVTCRSSVRELFQRFKVSDDAHCSAICLYFMHIYDHNKVGKHYITYLAIL